MEETQGETFQWNEPRENFIKYFIFIPQNEKLVETAKQIKAFIEPTRNNTLIQNYDRPTIPCNNIQTKIIPQSTRLQMENENPKVKSFRWKSYHSETTKPIRTVLKVGTTDKEDTDLMTTAEFPATFSQFKEGSQPINEAKAPEWLDAKIKTKEFDISNDERPKMEIIGDYWSEEKTTKIINLLKEFQDFFA